MFDLVIRRSRVIDGSGGPMTTGDVAIADDRVVALGELRDARGATEVDGRGLALAPGFSDTHTHDDRALLSHPLMPFKVNQGITTVITGNCGLSLAPLRLQGSIPPALDVFGGDPAHFVPDVERFFRLLEPEPPDIEWACDNNNLEVYRILR